MEVAVCKNTAFLLYNTLDIWKGGDYGSHCVRQSLVFV